MTPVGLDAITDEKKGLTATAQVTFRDFHVLALQRG
jgi:hypothetical protein